MPINYLNYLTTNITSTANVYAPATVGVQSTVTGCLIANNTANTTNVTMTITSGANTANIVRNVIIPSGTSLSIIDANKLIVGTGNYLAVSSAYPVDVTISAIEVS